MATRKKAARKAKTPETKSLISADRAAQYKVSDVRTSSGRKTIDNDDKVARLLRGKTPTELRKIATESGLGSRYKGWADHLNPGQVRMALGNALRAAERAKKGGKMKTRAKTKTAQEAHA